MLCFLQNYVFNGNINNVYNFIRCATIDYFKIFRKQPWAKKKCILSSSSFGFRKINSTLAKETDRYHHVNKLVFIRFF